jgi:lysophospholipase L1-like esterase
LVAVGLVPGGLGAGDASAFGVTQLAAILVGLSALGGALAGPRLTRAYRSAAAILVNTVLLLAVAELGAALVLSALPASAPFRYPGETSPYYQDKAWAAQYWREYHAVRQVYHPYFLWRARPFHGRLINIDSNGLRKTPGAHCEPGAYQVDAFGGSGLWGWGEPDSATLAAYLQAELSRGSQRPVCVRNFAQLGSNSTQDLIQLLRELQVASRVPDLVVFYNGVNDMVPPFAYGRAGTHFDQRIVTARVEGALDKTRSSEPELTAWLGGSSLWRLASRVRPERDGRARPAPVRTRSGPFTSDGLADSIVSTFVANLVTLDALAERYGFRYEVFWQPNALIGPKPLSREEQAMRAEEQIRPLVERVHSRISCVATRYAHLHDLTGAFADDTGLLYVDWTHVNSRGNRLIARSLARTIVRDSQSQPAGMRQPPSPPLPRECVGYRRDGVPVSSR